MDEFTLTLGLTARPDGLADFRLQTSDIRLGTRIVEVGGSGAWYLLPPRCARVLPPDAVLSRGRSLEAAARVTS